MLVTLPVTFPLTLLTTSEEYSGSLEADMSENHPSSSVKWEVLPLFCLKVSWMQFAGHSNVQVASVYEKKLFETLYKQVLWNIHESPWLMVPTPAALVCPETRYTMAEDTCNIASHLSIDRTHDKRGILRQARYIQAVLKQTFHVCMDWSTLVRKSVKQIQSFARSNCTFPALQANCLQCHNHNVLVAIPLAPVILSAKCVVAFVPCGRKPPNLFKCEVRSPSFLLSISFLAAICRAQQRAGCMCVWKRLARNPLQASTVEHSWITLAYHIPAAWVCPETRDTVAEDACNIASHLSIDLTHHKWGIFRQSWSRRVRESPNLFKCEVRSPSFLLSMFLECNLQDTATCRLQVYTRKICLKPFTSKYCGTFMNFPGLWFLSQQHWSVPRHMTLWQKILVTLPVTFPLTLLTTSEVYQGKMQDSVFFSKLQQKMFWKLT